MFIYNVTIKLTESIHADWINWMQQEHIPEVLTTGCFEKATLVRLLEIDDSDGPTYAVQYHAVSRAQYQRYISLYADGLRQKSFDRWGNQFMAFRSLMQVIN